MNMKKTKLLIMILFLSCNIFAQIDYEEYSYAIAAAYYSENEKAIEHFNKAEVFFSDKDFFFIERGENYYKLEKYNNAISDFKNAEKLNSKKGVLQLAKCYAITNNIDSSIFYLEKYLSQYDKIPKSEIKLDKAFEKIKNTEKWQNLWKKNWYSEVETKINKAIYLKKQEKYLEALSELNSVLKKNKRNHKAYFIKGEVFYATGNYKDAIKNYSKAIKNQPKNTQYLLARAKSYNDIKKHKKALDDYSSVLIINPENIQIYYKRALIFNELKRYLNAKNDISIYIQYFNRDSEVFYNCGLIYYNSEDYIGSLKYFNTAITKNNTNAKYYYARANAYSKTQTYDYAINDYSTALDINPSLTDIYLQMGIAEQEAGNMENACIYWQKSIKNKDYRANNYILKYCKNGN